MGIFWRWLPSVFVYAALGSMGSSFPEDEFGIATKLSLKDFLVILSAN
jgi:hypothetical protein